MVKLPALVFANGAGTQLQRFIKVVSKLRHWSIKISIAGLETSWTTKRWLA
jgi:hypothetical protein